jgi:uncharacterized repeat protein (TIGR01451 family)
MDLDLVLTGPQEAFVKRPVTYQATIINNGSLPAEGVLLTAFLPAGTQLESASDNGQAGAGQVRWLLGTLQPGTRRTVRYRLTTPTLGAVTNRVTAVTDGGLKTSAELNTTFRGASGLTFLTEPNENPVYVNSPSGYTITVLNTGSDAAKEVVLKVTVPEQMEITGIQGPGGLGSKQNGQIITFEPLPQLQSLAEVTYQVQVTPRKAGDVRFVVEMTAVEPKLTRPVRKETPTTIANPGPAVAPKF